MDTKSLAPADYLLRKIDTSIDWCKLYELVDLLYLYEGNRRPGIDPVALFKMILIQHFYGLPSPRRTADKISLNIACHCFLDYQWSEETPCFYMVGHNFTPLHPTKLSAGF